jgi:hypothetical protein
MKYNVQYSKPTDDKIAISEWREHITIVDATSSKEAVSKFNKEHQHLGTWYIMDCWKV